MQVKQISKTISILPCGHNFIFNKKNIKRRKSQKQPLQQTAFEDFPPRMQNTMKKLLIKRMTWTNTFQMKRSHDL